MPLGRAREAFSHPDWIFEIKWDGFRSLVHVEHDECRLMSRNGNDFKSFPVLKDAIATEIKTRSAVSDGEIVCLYENGKGFAFLPLSDRKKGLRSVVRLVPTSSESGYSAPDWRSRCARQELNRSGVQIVVQR